MSGAKLTLLIQEELVKFPATGLLPDVGVHIFGAVFFDSHSVQLGLDTGLQSEVLLKVPDIVSANKHV